MSMMPLAAVPIGKATGAVLSFATTIILTRTLGPDDFGAYATAMAVILVAAGIIVHPLDAATLRLVPALPASANTRALEYLRAGFRLRLVGAATVALALAVVAHFDGVALAVSLPVGHEWLVTVGIVALVLSYGLSVSLQALHRYRTYVEVDLAANGLRLAAVLGLASVAALDAGSALVAWVSVTLAVFFAGATRVPRAAFVGARVAPGTDSEILGYSRWVGASVILQLLVFKLDLFMTNAIAGGDAAGAYAAANNLAGVPELFASFLLAVFYPQVMRLKAAGTYRALLMRFLTIATPVALVGAVAGIALAERLVLGIYGADYEDSVDAFRILIAGTAVSFLVLPLAAPYVTLTLPRHLLAIEVMGLIAMAYGSWQLIPAFGIVGAAAAATGVRLGQASLILALVFYDTRARRSGGVAEVSP